MAGSRSSRSGLAPALLSLAFLLAPAAAVAQEDDLAALCAVAASGRSTAALRFCNLVAEGVEAVQPRIGLAAAGGDPVAGTASTLGLRIGRLPRYSIGERLTAGRAELHPIRLRGRGRGVDFAVV